MACSGCGSDMRPTAVQHHMVLDALEEEYRLEAIGAGEGPCQVKWTT